MKVERYASKAELLSKFAAGRYVLHLGAVGETCSDTVERVERAKNSVHAGLTQVAKKCVGIDYDEASVSALMNQGVFDNLICADVQDIERSMLPLPQIDRIVAGDVLEHLSDPGSMLDSARRIAEASTLLAITVPNALGLPIFIRNSLGKDIEGEDHVCSFNLQTLCNLLLRHGWAPQEAFTCYQRAATDHKAFRAGKTLFRLFPRWGGTLMIIARPQGT
jgi:2-polyprenyl-3-methyl-5-hydroxy-6-metoxy-1,4-benzoquinol methylase